MPDVNHPGLHQHIEAKEARSDMSMISDAQQAVEIVIGEPSPWRVPRIIGGAIFGFLLILVWKCSEVVGPNEQAYRTMFGRARFEYYDSGEGNWWKRYKERHVNKRIVRKLRKGEFSNQPHLQLLYGKPKTYGPGRYFKIPFTVLSFQKMDATPKNIDFDVFVEWEGQFRGSVQPIQLVVRVACLYVWDLSAQDVESTLNGIAKEMFRRILEHLKADEYIKEAEKVKRMFVKLSYEEFKKHGAAIERINIAAATPQTQGWIANAILQSGDATPVTIGAALAATGNGSSC